MCRTLKKKWTVIGVTEALDLKELSGVAIMRHDVDTKRGFAKSRRIAEIEIKEGIRSTFYFRIHGPYNPLSSNGLRFLRFLEKNKIEIGLHYETLSLSEGDIPKGQKSLYSDVKSFNKFFDIRSICAHACEGPYTNLDIWNKDFMPNKFDCYEAYIDLVGWNDIPKQKHIIYLSDAGGDWNFSGSPIEKIHELQTNSVPYVLVHPDNFVPDTFIKLLKIFGGRK